MSSTVAAPLAPSLPALGQKINPIEHQKLKPEIILRPSGSRGHAEHGGWLKSYHTFSFASYYTNVPREQAWNSLRVINEDRVAPSQGFPTHPHKEFEIFSYIIDGKILHKDSMHNTEILKRGDVQMTSAGTGIRHSEYNGGEGDEELHFLQCWAKPSVSGLTPNYYTRHYTDDEKRDVLLPIVAPLSPSNQSVLDTREGEGPTPIHSPLTLYASILSPSSTVSHVFSANSSLSSVAQPFTKSTGPSRKGYLHLIMRQKGYRLPHQKLSEGPKLAVELVGKDGENQVSELVEGDGLYLDQIEGSLITIKNVGEGDAEFVLFDLE
ncbi:Pirin-domain-containing protein [Meredithblackwellia eburnea MCA 4105]